MTLSMPTATIPGAHLPFYHVRQLRNNLIPYLEGLAAQGDILRIPLGPINAIYVNHPDPVREILVTRAADFHKPATVKKTAAGLFGQNLFTSDGEVWRVLRAAEQPAFHTQRIRAYAETMAAQTAALVDAWEDGSTVDIPAEMMALTLGITTQTLFGVNLREATGDQGAAGQGIARFIELFNQEISAPLPLWMPTPRHRELNKLVQLAEDLLQPIIEARRASGHDTGDVLSMLINAQAEDGTGILTDRQVRNEISNLFAAGYEVVSYTLAFTLYLLARHPEVEERVLQEIDSAIGTRPVSFQDLVQMPYLEMVLKESMRLLPVTTVLGRQAVTMSQVGGFPVPKDSLVFVAPWTLHRRADLFPDPLRFDPERFAPMRTESIPKYGYLPFSTGPRICLGNAFAMLQLRINLAAILQRFTLRPVDGYVFTPVFRFNTRPKHGLPMIAKAR